MTRQRIRRGVFRSQAAINAYLAGTSDADLLLGERASEPVLRQMPLDHYKVIEFATHVLMSGELKGLAEPALVLTPPPRGDTRQ